LDLSLIIKDLLTRREGIVIPGLGSLAIEYQSAKINPQRKVIQPPVKKLCFYPEVKADSDQILASSLSLRQNITLREAREQVSSFVSQINKQLIRNGRYELKGIGTFKKGENNQIHFIADEHFELNMGFEEIPTETFELEENKQSRTIASPVAPPPERKKSRKKNLIWGSLSVFLLLIMAGGYYIGFFDYLAYKIQKEDFFRQVLHQKEDNKKQVHSAGTTSDTAVSREVKEALHQMTSKKTALRYEAPRDTNTYYLIAGSFQIHNNARQFKKQINSRGFNAEILEKDNLYRVAIESFEKKENALVKLYQMRDSGKLKSIWLLTVRKKDR
jgi:hypothetical protein